MQKKIQCYDSEQYDNTGNGRISICINMRDKTPEEVKKEVCEIKDFYKMKNKRYRLDKKNDISRFPESRRSQSVMKLKKSKDFKDLHIDPGTGNTTFLIGSSKRGKSTLLMNIFKNYYNNKDDITTLFSINCNIPLYKQKKLIRCCKFDSECETLVKKMKYINHKCNNKYKFCVMFDDITNIRHNNLMNELILTYRNSKVSSIVSLQYPNLLSKASRGSINNLLFFGLNNDESIVVCLNSFLKSVFSKMGYKKEVDQINLYRQLTDNHQFIYLHPESGKISLHKLIL